MKNEVYGTCTICGQPVTAGQPRYTVTENHYDCEYPTGYVSPMQMFKEAEKSLVALTGLKPRAAPCRPGEGPVAKRIAARLAKLFKADHGWDIEPTAMSFWVQAPADRGPKFDLAVWGCSFAHPKHPNLKVNVHSWDTMTSLLKREKIKLIPDGSLSFDVG